MNKNIYEEIDFEKSLVKKLLELGYSESSIHIKEKTIYGKQIDLVVYEFEKPKIVFEITGLLRFSLINSNSLEDDVAKVEKLKFDPTVRQAQLLAQEVNAPYFAVSNGISILWFEVDENDGRPKLLVNPVLPNAQENENVEVNKNQILRVLFQLADIGRGYLDVQEYAARVGIVILARLWAEKGNSELERLLTNPNSDLKSFDEGFYDLHTHKHANDIDFYKEAFFTLNKINLSGISSADFIYAVNDFTQLFIDKVSYGEFKLPNWISEFMVRLLHANLGGNVLDIYSNFGDGVVAINKAYKDTRVVSVTSYSVSYIWDKVKRVVLGLDPKDVLYMPRLHTEEQKEKLKQLVTRYENVLVTPPFGGKPPSNENVRFRKSEENFLDLSLQLVKAGGRIVTIVPEGLLFSVTSADFRDYLLESTWIRAIISLEQFLPKSGIKASIIVMDKRSLNSIGGDIFMCRITSKDVASLTESNSSLLTSSRIQKILVAYESHIKNVPPRQDKNIWFTSRELLENKSWAVDYYDPSNQFEINAEYLLLPLYELASLRKGSPLTLDEHGTLQVIGPGALRSLSIDSAKLDKTTKEKLSKNQVVTKLNDILIHAVGTYRGQAALVEPDFEDFFVSRNIIVLRDISTKILPAYLAIALNSSFVRKQLEDRSTGSVFAQFSIGKLSDLQIPVPDLEKQKNIIDKILGARQKILEYEQQALVVQSALKEQQNNLQSILDNIHLGGGENA